MSDADAQKWEKANQAYLMAAVACVRARLEVHLRKRRSPESSDPACPVAREEERLAEMQRQLPAPSALELVVHRFGLSEFERDLLVLCAGVELDPACGLLCAEAQGDSRRTYPTFNLALASLRSPHWSALTPAGALRRWKLLEVTPGSSLTSSPLRIEERVLHALTGVNYLDERLRSMVRQISPPEQLAPSHRELVERAARLWEENPLALLLFTGGESVIKSCIASAAAEMLDSPLFVLSAADVPVTANERDTLARLWEREAGLQSATLLLEITESATPDMQQAVRAFVGALHARSAVALREPGDTWPRSFHRLEIDALPVNEQHSLWREAVGHLRHALNGEVERVAGQFSLPADAIMTAASETHAIAGSMDSEKLGAALWDRCRQLARPRMEDLAPRIVASATWEDLVLPEAQTRTLREIAAQVRERFQVYEQWGFGPKLSRGLGITALFAGASGTGKTLAAEVLANDLRLDLYRIDLSAVVSKYIGETEKNLRRVFDAAESGGAILLFDEADALFGKRGEVKDSHDRYANIEVSYLLQRMEAYRGLAILTSNLKNVLDPAFLRRLRFVVQFPFPATGERVAIWRRLFPPQTPCEGLNIERLAQLSLPGGNLRNIALNAAFLAASGREPVRMRHLLLAARSECAKLERPLTEAEIGGWE